MTLRHLNIFVAVYQNQSITKAAGQLHIAQPSVSRAVRELEEFYGSPLFDRIGRHIHVTDQGKILYEYAIHIVDLFGDMEKKLRNGDSSGILKVGSSITIGNLILPEVVSRFREKYPQMKVHVIVKNTATIEQYVMDNKIDFAFIEGESIQPQIRRVPFMNDRLCFVCAPNHPMALKEKITLEDVAHEDFLLREQGSAGRDIMESIFTLHHLQPEPTWESTSTQAILKALEHGLGVSILPYMLVKSQLEKGTLIERKIEKTSFNRQFSVIYHTNKYLTPLAKRFMEMCRQYAEEEMA